MTPTSTITPAKTRIAILLDENGKEIFRGHPADMPIRFGDDNINWTMNDAINAGSPIDGESDEELTMNEAG